MEIAFAELLNFLLMIGKHVFLILLNNIRNTTEIDIIQIIQK